MMMHLLLIEQSRTRGILRKHASHTGGILTTTFRLDLELIGLGRRSHNRLVLVHVKVLLGHVAEVEADVRGDEVGPRGAERLVAVEAGQRHALGEDHGVRDDAKGELLHVVLGGLDETQLDPEVGTINTKQHRGVDGERVAQHDHRRGHPINAQVADRGEVGGGRGGVEDHKLRDRDRLVQEHVALKGAVRHVLPHVVGRHVPQVVQERGACEEDRVVRVRREHPEGSVVANVRIPELLLQLVHYLGPEDDVPRSELGVQP
mmetsp:Transcript_24081/g.57400  ORF Transcript_24081/g.57400 Transcript_24081/m.57400 type:complete len:261 (+) Transcript_24081:97-879(+)